MVYEFLDAAQDRWRKVNGPEIVIHMRDGIEFKDRIRVQRSTDELRNAA